MTKLSTAIKAEKPKLSGNSIIDALLGPTQWTTTDGQILRLTFSFPTSESTWIDKFTSFSGSFAEDRKIATRAAINAWNEVANLNFTEIQDSSTQVGNIRFAFGKPPQGYEKAAGWASYPSSSQDGISIWINESTMGMAVFPDSTNTTQGGKFSGPGPLLHELGHAIGLKHGNEGEITLPEDKANISYSVVMNKSLPGTLYPSTPMLYDILAAQYLYGANMQTRAGDDVYLFKQLTDFSELNSRTIWDAGGNDTFDASAIKDSTVLDLRAGHFSTVGAKGYVNNIAIAFNVIIENAKGGSGSDLIIGNQVANSLFGGAGNDTLIGGGGNDLIDGGLGFDTLKISEKRVDFNIQKNTSQTVFNNKLNGEKISFANVERVILNDIAIAYDFAGTAGQAYRLYQAAFDRKPDLAGLGYWISDMDKGADLTKVAAGFMQSAEFQTLYGSNPNYTTLITNFYKNVLHRTPDQAGFDYWFKQLENKEITAAGALASFTESAENQAQVADAILVGIEYQVWQPT
jgi:hypothetical protein